ncbi:hypothetical protein EGR_06751 [Echinococcus granulosus]|uniref:Uncharacterized protein n=1 Tax=Echinococcus granulosus TaxID=6210 RepID=W6UXP3_ECHGR|nr:hypothetical protein EGR_06751 [Echinococcus granulosus]EUB58344.1 hypothetical protein EGR_06751 [Echinococcus granulosus]
MDGECKAFVERRWHLNSASLCVQPAFWRLDVVESVIIWDTKAFRGSYADEVVLSAVAANSSGGEIRNVANFSQGEITLRGLQPNHLYSVIVDIRMRHESLWKDTYRIRTLPAEEEGSTVSTDASGSISVAFAGIFLCLTVVLASALANSFLTTGLRVGGNASVGALADSVNIINVTTLVEICWLTNAQICLVMANSSLYCNWFSGDGFYKTSNSGGLLLHEQIILYWNVPVAYNCRAARHTHRVFSQVVCAGVSVRPAGR